MPTAAIKRALAEHNRDLAIQAVSAACMDVLTSAGLYLFITLAFFVTLFGRGHWFLYATGIFTVVFVLGVWSSRRGIDPLAGLDPFSKDDHGAVKATYALTGMIASPRHTVAGAASIIIHDPKSILASVGLW